MKRKLCIAGLSMLIAASTVAGTSLAEEPEQGSLTHLLVEDVAQLVDFRFDPSTIEYDITVFEDVYGIRFTPTLTGSADSSVSVTMSGSGMEEETITVKKNEQFELHLSEARECSAFALRMQEDDCDYTVIIEAANDTYTINVHRPGTDALSEQFERKTWTLESGKEMTYLLYVPADYSDDKEYPVVLAPHGGGQSAVDAKDILVRTAQATSFVKYGKEVIIVCPHSNYVDLDADPATYGWVDANMVFTEFGTGAYDILMDVVANYSVDKNRIYVAGASMGGKGTCGFLVNHPETFAGAIIGCPAYTTASAEDPILNEPDLSAIQKTAEAISEYDIPVWLVHAIADPTQNVASTYQLAEDLDRLGANYRITLFPTTDYFWPTAHFSWVSFFDHEENLDWLLAQSK